MFVKLQNDMIALCNLGFHYNAFDRTLILYAFLLHFFFPCTLAATFRRNAFSRMKPVASSWL